VRKNYFISLVSLILLSIIGVVITQVYWIKTSWENNEEAFSLAVNQILQSVSTDIQNRELNDYIYAYERLIDSVGKPDDSNFTDVFLFLPERNSTNLSTFFAYGILQEDYDLNGISVDPRFNDLRDISDYKSVKTTAILSEDVFNRENNLVKSISKIKTVERKNPFEVAKYRSIFTQYMSSLPIHKRLTVQEVSFLLKKALNEKKINTGFEFGIYNNNLSTKITSNNYSEIEIGPKYSTPIFVDEYGNGNYTLSVFFPDKENFVFSSVIGVAGLSISFSLFIVIVSFTALYQIIKQKKIAVMKTDFINNMSHEFKTPIATIGLALDAISNIKNINNPKSINKYVKMIREENHRMLKQVDGVLRISQLDKGTLPMDKQRINIYDIILASVSHVQLIVSSRNGKIKLDIDDDKPIFINGNKNHLTNLFINILDNSIKYSVLPPEIYINSKVNKNIIFISVTDNGIGMDERSQKLIFQKFYRVQSGNIHDIKGHGLGLTYVKKITDLHLGSLTLNSKKGSGTTFTVGLPLINDNITQLN
tara:strand:- start:2208 stop:3815 length:1608 start_codon:yes stop_codon:yes gene_type:complete